MLSIEVSTIIDRPREDVAAYLSGVANGAEWQTGVVESVKSVSDLYMPVAGEIRAVNEGLEDAPETINSDPYGEGWLIKIKMSDPSQARELISADEYAALTEE